MAHSFIDDSVTNGVEYWYCLAAFDSGDTSVPIDPLQNAFGLPDADANVIRAMPESSPAGYYSAQSTVLHTVTSDSSAGTIWPIGKSSLQVFCLRITVTPPVLNRNW